MKYNVNMTAEDTLNFNREVVLYINDNLMFIKESSLSTDSEALARAALDHYVANTEGSGDSGSYLSAEQEKQFYDVALRLFGQGYVENAGVLR